MGDLKLSVHYRTFYDYQPKEDAMDETCSMHGKNQTRTF